ncbi:permease [Cytobacillus gottheilii]|uniref:Permease n=1 Tax=Cytobacillus gottheilii TaxID=859144 RepID=A0ABX8FEN4_9BACI|nr:permease [Cytobacillus gottheilii]QVY62459.1 permease [Cytobacillus gottheilii]
MFSFQTFKDKRYWILLLPFLIVYIVVAIFSSGYFTGKPILALLFPFLSVMLFWVTYHLWKYVGDKKRED